MSGPVERSNFRGRISIRPEDGEAFQNLANILGDGWKITPLFNGVANFDVVFADTEDGCILIARFGPNGMSTIERKGEVVIQLERPAPPRQPGAWEW